MSKPFRRLPPLLLAALIPVLPAGLLADDYPGGHPATPVKELPKLRKQLRTGDWNARIDAVHRLGEMGERAVPSLREALEDRDWQVRFTAVHWLGRQGLPALSVLEETLRREPCRLIRISAVHWIGSIGPQAIMVLEAASRDESAMSRIASRYWLRKMGRFHGDPAAGEGTPREDLNHCESSYWPDGAPAEEPASESSCYKIPDSVHANTLCITGFMPVPSRKPGVITCCRRPPPGSLPPPETLSGRPRTDAEPKIVGMPEREIALRALAKREVRRKERLKQMAALWRKPLSHRADPEISLPNRKSIENKLAPPPGPPEYMDRPKGVPSRPGAQLPPKPFRYDPEREQTRPGISRPAGNLGGAEARLSAPRGPGAREGKPVIPQALILNDHGAPPSHDALPGLLETLRQGSVPERSRAADQIASLGPEAAKAVSQLTKALEDRSPRVRASAAFALGNIGRPAEDSVPDLVKSLRDKNADVRYNAAESLGRIGTPDARKAFERYLRREFRRSLRESRR